MNSNLFKTIIQRWSIVFKVLPILAGVIFLKFIVHTYGYEMISLNALFTSLIAATIFLLGFLISGVLSDYKESEKYPGELASSIEVLHDEAEAIYKTKNSKTAKEFIKYVSEFVHSLDDWFYKKQKTSAIFHKLKKMNDYFSELEKETQAGFIVRMKNEQNNIRKIITRIHTIRETNFVSSAYVIAEFLAFFLISGMIFVKVEPFYEALVFACLVTFMITYMIFLIKDLDDPFDYNHHGESGSEVSLKPLHNLQERLDEYSKKIK